VSQSSYSDFTSSSQGKLSRNSIRRLATLLLAAVVLAGIAVLHAAWPAAASHNALIIRVLPTDTPTATPTATPTIPPTLVVAPSSGQAGQSVSLSGYGFPREADTLPSQFTLDGTTMPSPSILSCPSRMFGFGTACNPDSKPYLWTIPAAAASGDHTFKLVILSAAGGPLVNVSATFTVLGLATATTTATATSTPTGTATPTATTTPTATATGTPTGTGTSVPSTASATSTVTPSPTSTPTLPATFVPKKPVQVPTNTPTPKAVPEKLVVVPIVVLVRPEFNFNLVAIVVRTVPGATVQTTFSIVAPVGGNTQQVFAASNKGQTSKAGVYYYNMKIAFKNADLAAAAHAGGQATLMISESDPTGSRVIKKSYRYRVYS